MKRTKISEIKPIFLFPVAQPVRNRTEIQIPYVLWRLEQPPVPLSTVYVTAVPPTRRWTTPFLFHNPPEEFHHPSPHENITWPPRLLPEVARNAWNFTNFPAPGPPTPESEPMSTPPNDDQPICIECPLKHFLGCCSSFTQFSLNAWLTDWNVPDRFKNIARNGDYSDLEPSEFVHIPLFILRRLATDAAKTVTATQMRTFLSYYPHEVVGTVNILRHMRQDHFNVFITNLKVDLERDKSGPYSTLSPLLHRAIALTTEEQWGPYQGWTGPQLAQLSYWVPYLPCETFYMFREQETITTVLPAAVLGQSRLSECAKHALYTRLYQARQLMDIETWSPQKVLSFSYLLSGGPPTLLQTFSAKTLQDSVVLRTLTDLPFSRAQVEALLEPLASISLSIEMVLAMSGNEGSGVLLRYIPPKLLINSFSPTVYIDVSVSRAFKQAFCFHDPKQAYRSGYQVYWWYRDPQSPRRWAKKEIQEVKKIFHGF